MPWPPNQQRAIAANLARKGKSSAQIADFFHKHGYPADKKKRKHSMVAQHLGRKR